MILADTDVLIDYLAGAEPATSLLRTYIAGDLVQTSAVTCFELLSGAKPGKRGQAVRDLLLAIPVLPLDRLAAERASAVRLDLERSGQSIGMADSLIAGIALAHAVPLLTRNRKHFERVADLRLLPLALPLAEDQPPS